mmetsp:Transcript_56348/g.131988  ORF Transcript_56348/g.131988 Transcript_56348/m.131988 type:complete len:243 (-) Transcript_56348:2643-3371(-)
MQEAECGVAGCDDAPDKLHRLLRPPPALPRLAGDAAADAAEHAVVAQQGDVQPGDADRQHHHSDDRGPARGEPEGAPLHHLPLDRQPPHLGRRLRRGAVARLPEPQAQRRQGRRLRTLRPRHVGTRWTGPDWLQGLDERSAVLVPARGAAVHLLAARGGQGPAGAHAGRQVAQPHVDRQPDRQCRRAPALDQQVSLRVAPGSPQLRQAAQVADAARHQPPDVAPEPRTGDGIFGGVRGGCGG